MKETTGIYCWECGTPIDKSLQVKKLQARVQELEAQNESYRAKLVEIANEDGGPMEGSITARRQRDIARTALDGSGGKR